MTSFAEKYGKKPSFTSQSVLDKAHEEKKVSPIEEMAHRQKEPEIHIDPLKKAQADLIYLVKGIDAGRNAWYYVLVERMKLQLFLKALNDDIIHLENYGKILYSAYGDEPPVEITDKIKAEYGID